MKFKSVATRIIASVLPVVAVVTILSIAMIYGTMKEQIDAQFNERMAESLSAAELQIDAELMMNANVARSLAIYTETCSMRSIENGELADFLLETIPSNKNTVGGGIWFEPYALYADKQYYGPYVYVEEGVAYYAADYASEVDYHSQAWYIDGKNADHDIVWSSVYHDPVPNITMITASMPVYTPSGAFWGVTTADMALTDIQKISESISVGETGRAFILGAEGEFITFWDGSKNLDMHITEDGDAALAALGRTILENGEGSAFTVWNGAERRVFFTQLPKVGWHLVVMIDDAEVGHFTNSVVLSMAVIPVLGLLLVVVFIVLTARYFRRVANKVNHFADKAAMGDLSERIDITERDEFGVMEDRLNIMMDNMADMTARSETALAMAQAANRAKTEFLSNMSHEMRTPMNAIIGMVQIARETTDPGKIVEYLTKVDTASKTLLGLINDVLDMAKIEANKIQLEAAPFSIQDVFSEMEDVFGGRAQEKNLTLEASVDGAVPEMVVSDKFRYQQIVMNLLSNAIKFTPSGGRISLTARLAAQTDETATIETTVRDTGIGVSQDAAQRLFHAFEQADSSVSRRYGGTGLGLSISKNLAELMHGEIRYRPNEEAGSIFSFTIVVEKTDTVRKDIASVMLPKTAYDFSGLHLLLVEDVEINREIVSTLLKKTDIVIDCAEDGLIACEMFASSPEKYDLIFMDIQMPNMDGITATQKIRAMEKGKTVPIIAMSANAFQEDVETSLAAGMNGHISKPIDIDIVLATIEEHVRPKAT